MNRNFVFNRQEWVEWSVFESCKLSMRTNRLFGKDEQGGWWGTASTLNRWLWGALCCGVPGIPCYFCTCCERIETRSNERERPRVNQSTATTERMVRPHRPYAPHGRKHTPETLSAVRCALTQLQEEPTKIQVHPGRLPILPEYHQHAHSSEPG